MNDDEGTTCLGGNGEVDSISLMINSKPLKVPGDSGASCIVFIGFIPPSVLAVLLLNADCTTFTAAFWYLSGAYSPGPISYKHLYHNPSLPGVGFMPVFVRTTGAGNAVLGTMELLKAGETEDDSEEE